MSKSAKVVLGRELINSPRADQTREFALPPKSDRSLHCSEMSQTANKRQSRRIVLT